MSICDNTIVNQETPLKLQSIRKIKHVAMLAKKLSMTLELDGVPRYFIKKVPRYRYSVPSTDSTGNGTKKYRGTVPCTKVSRYCPPLHTSLLYHTEVRWLSCGNATKRLFEMKNKILLLFKELGHEYSKYLKNDEFVQRLAYLSDIFEAFNIMNL